ncbi:ArsR family transcriptional regulator [Halobacillus halophilus]|uniref:ArsR family transcription regulator n=1 Tax=Halobacillus halophilus (strain ATCC 35676 / DSM 2266 / JCM 20832 / KCTC 3685 / LMG 17431 / NBRC 102448 / NCIMB 2269) TaxID=866895 RepID=I0JLP2_HALH3|nr:metalloregulator ArsR/SmtB family transcription factor [Halobacillus halophilus]ASF39167.1 ArsR family transcriptional regulator [Halobacillus halophilus]CCG45062.1 ArsR family transcription regulator [Halobacillus halophilus DSM 2266]
MQLDKMVAFHKAAGDPTRLRIIALLRQGPLHGQAIAGKLGLRPPTITHHLKKLKDTGMVYSRRDKNTIYFYLDEKKLTFMAEAVTRIGDENVKADKEWQVTEKEERQILQNFITVDGKLKQMPSQLKKRVVILAYYVKAFQPGKTYEEKEVNEYIQTFFEDYATVRREWIMHHFMYRENNRYELNPEEMWPVVV